MASRTLAYVLGGGGARGALQAGALRALWEAGYRPDFAVGTSIGALNAACLGLYGADEAGLAALEQAWRDAAQADLLPANYLWLTIRTLFGRGGGHLEERMRAFLIEHGLTPELRFADLPGIPIYLVAADLNSGRPVLYGDDPNQRVMEGVLASCALPPWVHPLNVGDRLLVDGGAVSNLPIEAALARGAGEIIALDISEPAGTLPNDSTFGPWINKLSNTINQRQLDLELALAAALNVPVRRLWLRFHQPVPVWDFSHTEELIAAGYAQARAEIATWQAAQPSRLRNLRSRLSRLNVWSGGRPRFHAR